MAQSDSASAWVDPVNIDLPDAFGLELAKHSEHLGGEGLIDLDGGG